MALAVLVFHYDKWLTGIWDASTLQGKLGIYAVSIFFVLSGLTLTLVYRDRLKCTFQSWGLFFRKRIYRIFPLLWLATAATLVLDENLRPIPVIFLNFTGLFGFVNPANDIATGAWSIGCELVYYAAFPTLFLVAKRSKLVFLGVFMALFAYAVWTAFYWFSPEKSIQSEWWETYVQAGNHAFFFTGGMAIGIFRTHLLKIPVIFWQFLLAASVVFFIAWPIAEAPFFLVSGLNRLLLSMVGLVAVVAYFNSNINLGGIPHRLLSWLGAVSYSLYLLHPLVYRATQGVQKMFSNTGLIKTEPEHGYWSIFIAAMLGTLFFSHLSYQFLEKPLAKKG